jgi:SET domain-containing protein
MSLITTLLFLFVMLVLSVVIIQHIIVPSLVNYQHGLLMSPDFTLAPSEIQGIGLFTKRARAKGERLFVAIHANENVTPVGSKINHCPGKNTDGDNINAATTILPNTYLSETPDKTTGEWWIIALRNISAGEELTVDYTNTPDFINKPDPGWRCPL